MGLLDDAIREHLELKRRAGADPGEIARTESEALSPVAPDPAGPPAETVLTGELGEDDGAADGSAITPVASDLGEAGEETAELDMRAVLDDQGREHDEVAAGREPVESERAAAPVRAPAVESSHEESLEWEMPGNDPDAPVPEIPGQEKLSFE